MILSLNRTEWLLSIFSVSLLLNGCSFSSDTDGEKRSVPVQAAAFLVQAQEALQGGDFTTAFAFTDSARAKADRADPRFLADVEFLRGRIHSELNQVDKAREAYERVLTLQPEYEGAWFNLGNIAFRQDRYGDAVAAYRREQQIREDPQILLYLGRAYQEFGRFDSARIAFEQVIALDDSLAEPHARLGHLYDQEASISKAVSYYRKAHELEPGNNRYRYLLGSELIKSGNLEEAVEHLKAVIERTPDDFSAHNSLAQALIRLGRTEEARPHLAAAEQLRQIEVELGEWERMTRIDPESPAVWATYGVALRMIGQDEKALRALKTAIHLDPENPDIRFELANLYLKYGEMDAALAHYGIILRQDSMNVAAWVNAGIAYARTGRTEAARKAWEGALRQNPDRKDARAYLAQLPR